MNTTFEHYGDWGYFEHEVDDIPAFAYVADGECEPEAVPNFVSVHGYLPTECRSCWRLHLFTPRPIQGILERDIKYLIECFPLPVKGGYCDVVLAFNCFKNQSDMLRVKDVLDKQLKKSGIQGRSLWRVACKSWQDDYPQFFKSDKELKPVSIEHEMTMKDWMAGTCR